MRRSQRTELQQSEYFIIWLTATIDLSVTVSHRFPAIPFIFRSLFTRFYKHFRRPFSDSAQAGVIFYTLDRAKQLCVAPQMAIRVASYTSWRYRLPSQRTAGDRCVIYIYHIYIINIYIYIIYKYIYICIYQYIYNTLQYISVVVSIFWNSCFERSVTCFDHQQRSFLSRVSATKPGRFGNCFPVAIAPESLK